MGFATFTRPDGSPVSINTAEVLRFAPVPSDGPLALSLIHISEPTRPY